MTTHAPDQEERTPQERHDAGDHRVCAPEECAIRRIVDSAPVPTPEQAARLARLLRIGGA